MGFTSHFWMSQGLLVGLLSAGPIPVNWGISPLIGSRAALVAAAEVPAAEAGDERTAGREPATTGSGTAPEPSRAEPPSTLPQTDLSRVYRIGAGDVLQIMVWKEPDASVPSVVVRPDGKIALPLLKEITVADLTPAEAEHAIGKALSRYIQGADVTVVVTGINSRKAYIIGAVRKEGPVALQHPMSVLQAISEAGGLTDYAKRKKIYVLRTSSGRSQKIAFNYEAVIRGEQIKENILLEPNDTIVIPY